MIDLTEVFKEMILAQDKAMALRLAGQDNRVERVRGERLEANFNERMKACTREEQIIVVNSLVLDGYLPVALKYYMDTFDGRWQSINNDFHKIALKVLSHIQTKLPIKDILDLASHEIKHMGVSWDDYYKIMAEIRKILKFH